MEGLFGKYGLKGVVNDGLSAELALRAAKAFAFVLHQSGIQSPKILIGRDSGISGDMLEAAVCAGLCSSGIQVVSVGIMPTPAVSYLIRKYKMDGGVMISAMSATYETNAIRFGDATGKRIDRKCEQQIEQLITGTEKLVPVSVDRIGKISRLHTGLRDYLDYVKSFSPFDMSDTKVALDCANGAACECAKIIFKELGADVEKIHNHPDGFNINDNCGYHQPDDLCRFVTSHHCDVGIAYDGDGGRFVLCDSTGKIKSSGDIEKLCASYLKSMPCDKAACISDDAIAMSVMSAYALRHGSQLK